MPAVSRMGDKDTDTDALIEGSMTVFAGDAAGAPSFSNIQVTMPERYDVEFALPMITNMGRAALFDEPDTIRYIPEDYPSDTKEAEETDEDGNPVAQQEAEGSEEATPKETPLTDGCPDIGNGPVDPNTRLSEHFTIGDLTTGTLYGADDPLGAQNGTSEQTMVCNMHGLANNILEPLYEEFGPFRINSGFRTRQNGSSQHEYGMAVDIQEPSWSAEKHLEVAKWLSENTATDQTILEHGNASIPWIHVSHDVNKGQQRGENMTMINGDFHDGFKLYY